MLCLGVLAIIVEFNISASPRLSSFAGDPASVALLFILLSETCCNGVRTTCPASLPWPIGRSPRSPQAAVAAFGNVRGSRVMRPLSMSHIAHLTLQFDGVRHAHYCHPESLIPSSVGSSAHDNCCIYRADEPSAYIALSWSPGYG